MIPAVISLILFLVSTYALIPLWRRYRARYSQYIPLDRISDHTSTIRGRVQDALARWLMPANWRWQFAPRDRLVVGGFDIGIGGGGGRSELDDAIAGDGDAAVLRKAAAMASSFVLPCFTAYEKSRAAGLLLRVGD